MAKDLAIGGGFKPEMPALNLFGRFSSVRCICRLKYYINCNIMAMEIQADGNVLVESSQATEGLDAARNGRKARGVATVPVLAGARTSTVYEASSFKAPTAF